MNNFERLLTLLSDGEVEFVVIGGVAVSAHGSAYLTRDWTFVTSVLPRTYGDWWPC
jgi:hypothetical protein